MAPKQRMRIANEKASKNITQRGNVPKSTVSEKPPFNLGQGFSGFFFYFFFPRHQSVDLFCIVRFSEI